MFSALKDKVVLITGAASGIGQHMALEFAKQRSLVVIADLNLGAAQEVAKTITAQYQVDCLAIAMDVSNEEQVNDGIQQTVKHFKRLNLLISNAGIQTISPLVDFSFSAWKRLIDIHLHGTFLCTRAAMQQMIKQITGGRILVTGSVHSVEASLNKAAYVAAKHAQLGLVRSIAKEGAAHNISANLICPGFVKTPLVEKQIPEQAKSLGLSEEQIIKEVMLGETVNGEFTTLDDVATCALFLASFKSNALTGQSVLLTNGWHMQ